MTGNTDLEVKLVPKQREMLQKFPWFPANIPPWVKYGQVKSGEVESRQVKSGQVESGQVE